MWVSEFLLVSIDLSTAAKFTLVGFLLLTHALQAETLKIMECQAQMIKSIKSLTFPGQFARCSHHKYSPYHFIPSLSGRDPNHTTCLYLDTYLCITFLFELLENFLVGLCCLGTLNFALTGSSH